MKKQVVLCKGDGIARVVSSGRVEMMSAGNRPVIKKLGATIEAAVKVLVKDGWVRLEDIHKQKQDVVVKEAPKLVTRTSYLRNMPLENNRTMRMEIVGDISKAEEEFLNGITHLASGTINASNDEHVKQVSMIMSKMVEDIIEQLKKNFNIDDDGSEE